MLGFLKKKEKHQPLTSSNCTVFEAAFEKRIGLHPTDYISNKISSGCKIWAIRNLFNVLSAEIASQSHSKAPGFDYYYEKVLHRQIITPANSQKMKEFAASQLIGKNRFLQQYDQQLQALSENSEFRAFVNDLRTQLAGLEQSDPTSANKQIADYFYKNSANTRFHEVQEITGYVLSYGKQASAHISIYYAMYLYE